MKYNKFEKHNDKYINRLYIKYIMSNEYKNDGSYIDKSTSLIKHILIALNDMYIIETKHNSIVFNHVELISPYQNEYIISELSMYYEDLFEIKRNDENIIVCDFNLSNEIKKFTVVFYIAKNMQDFETYKNCFDEKNKILI